MQILRDLFGNVDNILQNTQNILVGISQVQPRKMIINDDGDDELETVELCDVKDQFNDTTGMPEDSANIINCLTDRLFLYHPLDNGNESWDTQASMIAKLDAMPGLAEPGAIFQSVG